MRIAPLPALRAAAALAALAAAGCSTPFSVASSTVLGPGGRAEGRIAAGASRCLRLSNRGPGRVDFVVRKASGGVLSSGALGEAECCWPDPGEPMVVVFEAWKDEGGAVVAWTLEGEGGAGIDWDLTRAHP